MGGRGDQRTVLPPSQPCPTLPICAQTPHFPWAVSSASQCPPPTPPSQDVPGQTLLFPPPTSQLCLSRCPDILSVPIKSEPCASFCSISRLKVLQARDCVSCTSPCERRGGQPMMAKLKSLAASLLDVFLPPGLCTCHSHCLECRPMFTPND